MARRNKKKNKHKKILTQDNTTNPPITLLSYILFFLGSIGELILVPIKFVLHVFFWIKNTLPAILKRELRTLPTIKLKTRMKVQAYTNTLLDTLSKIPTSKPIVRSSKFSLSMYNNLQKWNINYVSFIRFIRKHWLLFRINFIMFPRRKRKQYTKYSNKTSSPLSIIARSAALILLGSLVMLLFTIGLEMAAIVKALPNPALLTTRDIPLTTKIYDRNDILLYEFYQDQNRTIVPLQEIPESVKQATIAIEDREFYHHQGFSIRGIIRASRETLLNENLQGGSTITQQLIKSALLTPEVSLRRKIKELILALWAEHMYSKDQILEMYLNQVPYGGTAWGIESASQTFFNKHVSELTLAEATLLAGLPQAPSEYSPFGSDKNKAINRQHEVLRRMKEDGYISQSQLDEAKNEKLIFAVPQVPIRAPHFVLYAKEYLEKRYGERQILQGGLRIKTTLDVRLQDKVQEIVASEIEKVKNLQVGNGAVLVTDPTTGDILAMVGSKDYFNTQDDGNVNVTTALRQPGSSIKVVTYTAALERGFTAATLLDDSPITYRILGQPPYSPVNYDNKFRGLVSLRYALGNSYNIPAVKTLDRIGIMTMIEKGREMGINTWDDTSRFGLSLTLGGGEVTMIDMAEVYGTLANEGKRVNLSPILEITDYTGKVIQKGNQAIPVQATSPEIAFIISDILSDNTARTQAFGPNSSLVIPGKTVSVKTGTTNEKRDNWTIGYTPSSVVTVWVGNNDNSPMNPQLASGVTGAAPIWNQVMKEVLKDKPNEVPQRPPSIITVPCYFGRQEYFIAGTEPKGGRCQSFPTPTISPTP